MVNIKIFESEAEKLYQKIWDKFCSAQKREPYLSLSTFLRSNRVNKRGFKEWREKNGLSLPKTRQRTRKNHKEKLETSIIMKNEVNNKTPRSDSKNNMSNDLRNDNVNTRQYWWLNLDSMIWDLNKAKRNEMKKLDIQFIDWISSFLIDKEDNPHIGRPIAQRELAISLLDYCGITVEEKTIKSAYQRIRQNLNDYIRTSNYVVDPPAVLKTQTDYDNGFRRCAAWQYPKTSDGFSIPTDSDGNRMPRELVKKAPYPRVYYFYRKNHVPINPFDGAHINDEDYVQEASETGTEMSNYFTKDSSSTTSNIHIKQGDSIIACTNNKIVAFIDAVFVKEQEVELKITKKLPQPIPFSSLKIQDCNYNLENKNGLIPLTSSIFNRIIENIDKPMVYTEADLLKEVFIDEKTINQIVRALSYKKNIILQGVPGVGKTFIAKRLAYAIMGHKDDEKIRTVQFHPNYTYEDFIIGYKPCDDGKFQLTPGIFMEFCNKAAEDKNKDNKYFFIIDEINRGNLSKILGEAFTLIDKDHREESIKLANSDENFGEFKIPENVYIIGLMNTADRSLAMLDYALLRRFEFLSLKPAFKTESFKNYQRSLESELFNKITEGIVKLNEKIAESPALGEGFCIGHSYFCISKERNKREFEKCGKDINAWLNNVIYYEIIPILKAYCFDDEETFEELSSLLQNIFDDKR